MSNKKIRELLLDAGVNQLREFGYKSCDKTGIMSNFVFASFFKEMLEGTKGKKPAIDKEIDLIISEIQPVIDSALID